VVGVRSHQWINASPQDGRNEVASRWWCRPQDLYSDISSTISGCSIPHHPMILVEKTAGEPLSTPPRPPNQFVSNVNRNPTKRDFKPVNSSFIPLVISKSFWLSLAKKLFCSSKKANIRPIEIPSKELPRGQLRESKISSISSRLSRCH
jgi:hypothetical protein